LRPDATAAGHAHVGGARRIDSSSFGEGGTTMSSGFGLIDSDAVVRDTTVIASPDPVVVVPGQIAMSADALPAGSVTWWCAVDNEPALFSFVGIRTFVLNDGSTLVTFSGTGPLRLDVYTAYDLQVARTEVVIQRRGRQVFQGIPAGATGLDAWWCPIDNI